MSSISTLLGSGNAFSQVLLNKSRIPGAVTGIQTVDSVKQSISDSIDLSDDNKTQLTSLTDTVNQYASGNQKLLRDVAGLSNLLAFGNHGDVNNNGGSSPYAKLLNAAYGTGKSGSLVDLLS